MSLFENIKNGGGWEIFSEELLKVKRDGIKELVKFLEEKTDIKEAPASSKYHSHFPGGLLYHSIKTKNYLDWVMSKADLADDKNRESRIIVGLCHDFCKLNYYKIGKVWDKEWKEKHNEWRKIDQYVVENQLPIGHGEKSLLLVNKFISLLPAEMCAIRWHMGAWEQSLHFFNERSKSYREATEKYPLVKALQVADQMAELFEGCHHADQGL